MYLPDSVCIASTRHGHSLISQFIKKATSGPKNTSVEVQLLVEHFTQKVLNHCKNYPFKFTIKNGICGYHKIHCKKMQ